MLVTKFYPCAINLRIRATGVLFCRAGKSITGGRVYRGPTLPELDGRYIYADYVTGKLWALKLDDQNQNVEKNSRIPSEHLSVTAFGEDEQGELYILVQSGSGKNILRLDALPIA